MRKLIDVVLTIRHVSLSVDTGHKWAISPRVTALRTDKSLTVTRARPRHHPGERRGGGTWSGQGLTLQLNKQLSRQLQTS